MVTVEANDEFLYLDLAFPTTKLHMHGRGVDNDKDAGGDDINDGLNGMEAAFQVRMVVIIYSFFHRDCFL